MEKKQCREILKAKNNEKIKTLLYEAGWREPTGEMKKILLPDILKSPTIATASSSNRKLKESYFIEIYDEMPTHKGFIWCWYECDSYGSGAWQIDLKVLVKGKDE